MKLYAYGGYTAKTEKPPLVILPGASRRLWKHKKTLLKGSPFLEYELSEGLFKIKTISYNIVEIMNKGDKDLILKFIKHYKG